MKYLDNVITSHLDNELIFNFLKAFIVTKSNLYDV